MNELKLKNLLGLSQRAKLLVSGNFSVHEALKANRVKMLLVVEDASKRTVEEYKKISAEKNLPMYVVLDKESLGQCLGKGERTVAAILDEGFKKSIEKIILQTSEKEKV